MSSESDHNIKPGDLFEDEDLHPVVCLDSSGENLFSVSLIDGTCREHKSKDTARLLRLSVADAIAWKFSGPGSKKELISKPWWRSNKGIDPVASYYPTFPESVAVPSGRTFKPGDFYEGHFFHPCICLWVIGDARMNIRGVSLVNGIYPLEEDLMANSVHKLTPQEAWLWRTKGPQDIYWSDLPREEALAEAFVDTDNEAHPRRRWWK
jgi:hypothetical protein